MAIKYNVTKTTYMCPHCDKILKQNSDAWWPLAFFVLPLVFIGLILRGIKLLLDKIFYYDSIKIGDPYFKCVHCGKEIRSNGTFEWGELDSISKHNWAFRHLMRINYFFGIVILIALLLLVGCLIDNNFSGNSLLEVSLILILISIVVLFIIYYLRNQSFRNGYVTLCQTDYDFIKNSWVRLHNRFPLITETETIKIWGKDKIIEPPKAPQSNILNNEQCCGNTQNSEQCEESSYFKSSSPQDELQSPWDVWDTMSTNINEDISEIDERDEDD